MTKKQIRKMLFEVISRVDYDIYRSMLPQFSEELEETEELMDDLVAIAKKHIKDACHKS